MSREEALNKAIGILTYNQVNFCKSKEAVANMNEIIEALEKIDQEQCGDCISRQAVLDVIEREQFKGDAISEIEKLPSVIQQPKMGYISIDDVMSVFDDFMRGDADENDTKTFLAMLKDKAEIEE